MELPSQPRLFRPRTELHQSGGSQQRGSFDRSRAYRPQIAPARPDARPHPVADAQGRPGGQEQPADLHRDGSKCPAKCPRRKPKLWRHSSTSLVVPGDLGGWTFPGVRATSAPWSGCSATAATRTTASPAIAAGQAARRELGPRIRLKTPATNRKASLPAKKEQWQRPASAVCAPGSIRRTALVSVLTRPPQRPEVSAAPAEERREVYSIC